jgi:hypothetical protein
MSWEEYDDAGNVLFAPMTFTDCTYFMVVVMTTTGFGDQGSFVHGGRF